MINLYSDTQTRPSEGMRRAIATADVGDEQRREDPTTRRLEERVAELLGHEAGLFLPSGTMCNQIALRLHARPGGDELILDRAAHPIIAEAGGPAWNAGLMIHALDGDGGIFTGDQVRAAIRPDSRYMPRSRVVSVEQTTNMGGGRVWPLESVHEVLEAAREHGLRTHMDGARLMNAVVASGVSAAEYAGGFDTAWLDFTKGLGAPVGAVLCGSAELIEEGWRWKQQMGGAMRQAGIVAAGCLYALDHNVDRLAEDHEHARVLAEGLAELGCEVISPETNIVIFSAPEGFVEGMARHAVELSDTPDGRARAVTHLDVSRAEVDEALKAARDLLLP
ncbi:MAG: threonine aldolase [Thermoleophilaceae bacterium]|nr:threonine aldolase [Thermoleophilaceae bacterium]